MCGSRKPGFLLPEMLSTNSETLPGSSLGIVAHIINIDHLNTAWLLLFRLQFLHLHFIHGNNETSFHLFLCLKICSVAVEFLIVPLRILVEKISEAFQRNETDILIFPIRTSFFNKEPEKFPNKVAFQNSVIERVLPSSIKVDVHHLNRFTEDIQLIENPFRAFHNWLENLNIQILI